MKSRNVSVSDLSPRALAQAAEQMRAGHDETIDKIVARSLAGEKPKRAKYGNTKTTYTNSAQVTRTYDSKKEANYAAQLDLEKRAGDVWWWIPQVRIPLPGGVAYVADFLVARRNGVISWVDVKGRDTPMSQAKRKIVKAIYGIDVEIV